MSSTASNSSKWPLLLLALASLVSAVAQQSPQCEFVGNVRYKSATLQGIIADAWKAYVESRELSHVDDAAALLSQHYRREGHYFAEVDYDLADQRVIFRIEEYHAVVVKKLDLANKRSGNSLAYSEERLRKFLTPPPLTGERFFVKARMEDDKKAIDDFYLSEGYLDAASELVYRFAPEPPNATTVEVTLAIDEGPRFFLDAVRFVGNRVFAESELRQTVGFAGSQVYTPGLHQRLAASLRERYLQSGYARVVVKPAVENLPAKGGARQGRVATLHVEEGRQNRIGRIAIAGNELTESYIVMRQLDIGEGDVYDVMRIRSSKQNLYDTRLFAVSEIEEHWADNDRIDLLVKLEERDSQSITFNLGYATTYGVTGGVTYEHINIFGTFRKFTFSVDSTLVPAELSKSEIMAQITEPQLFGSRTWAADLFSFMRYEETPSFTVFERGGGFVFRHRFSPELSGQFGYNLTWSEILEVQEGVDEKEGTTLFSTLTQRFTLNLRDNDSYPTAGSYHILETEQSLTALAAQIDYCKVYIHSAWYVALYDRVVLTFSLRGGVITPFGNSDKIPIQKRYFSGGSNSVRSFQEKKLPPLDEKDNPTGGEGLFLGSAELRVPIYGNLGFSLFGDSGQIMPQVRTWRDYRVSHLKYALGGSIWYNTPIGPLRFDMGFNPEREENPQSGKREALFAWFIAIGFSF